MEKRLIKCTDLTEENFTGYGVIITGAGKAPDADIPELKFWNKLGVMNHKRDTSISIVQTYGEKVLLKKPLSSIKRQVKPCFRLKTSILLQPYLIKMIPESLTLIR